MQKHAHLNIKLHPSQKSKLKKGDAVAQGEVLADASEEIDELDLVALLKIKPPQLAKHMLVNPGDEIAVGQVLIKKGGAFSSQVVRSPVAGVFGWSDEKNGIAAIKRSLVAHPATSPVEGIVVEVDQQNHQIIIEVEGTIIEGTKGGGSPVVGILCFLTDDTTIQLPDDLEQSIVVVKDASSSMIAKIDALGARAIIGEVVEETHLEFPYLVVEAIEGLKKYQNQNVMMLGSETQLLVLGNSTSITHKSKK